jgi:hypothetical protein
VACVGVLASFSASSLAFSQAPFLVLLRGSPASFSRALSVSPSLCVWRGCDLSSVSSRVLSLPILPSPTLGGQSPSRIPSCDPPFVTHRFLAFFIHNLVHSQSVNLPGPFTSPLAFSLALSRGVTWFCDPLPHPPPTLPFSIHVRIGTGMLINISFLQYGLAYRYPGCQRYRKIDTSSLDHWCSSALRRYVEFLSFSHRVRGGLVFQLASSSFVLPCAVRGQRLTVNAHSLRYRIKARQPQACQVLATQCRPAPLREQSHRVHPPVTFFQPIEA